MLPSSCSRVDDGWLDNAGHRSARTFRRNGGAFDPAAGFDVHVTILDELSDTRSGVGLLDLGSLLGVEPDCKELVEFLVHCRLL